MKLFQRLLVAPAALGLLSPLAASATEVNLDNVADFAGSPAAVATSAQFSDVAPGDWAYTALQNLSESYGCVDNAYTQNLKNGQSLTRYEAAALVNACLDSGLTASNSGLSPEAARLTNEFASEMAILKGRVDGLETRVNEFQAGQFSSTTKLSGGAVFTLGAVDQGDDGTTEQTAMQYAFNLDLNSSFTGEDNLYVGIETGNAADPLEMDSAATGDGTLNVHALHYTFPVGDFSITAGPLIDQEDIVSATVSTYSDSFRLAGQPYSLENIESGPGVGIVYSGASGFNASLAAIADDGEDADLGLFAEEGDDVITASIGFDGDIFGGGIIYATGDEHDNDSADGYDSFGYGIYFAPEGLPTFNLSYDTKDPEGSAEESDSWMFAIDYGIGAGTLSAAYQSTDDGTNDLNSYELYYDYPIADGFSVKPGVFIEEQASGDDHTGVVVETTFSF